MSDPQNPSTLEQSLNWIGDRLLDARNYAEIDFGTQRFLGGMNVSENYKVIYEKINNGTDSEWSVKPRSVIRIATVSRQALILLVSDEHRTGSVACIR